MAKAQLSFSWELKMNLPSFILLLIHTHFFPFLSPEASLGLAQTEFLFSQINSQILAGRKTWLGVSWTHLWFGGATLSGFFKCIMLWLRPDTCCVFHPLLGSTQLSDPPNSELSQHDPDKVFEAIYFIQQVSWAMHQFAPYSWTTVVPVKPLGLSED